MVNVDNRGNPRDPRSSNNSLYFIVGALVIAVLIIGYFMYGGDADVDDADVNVTTEEPAVAPAGDTNVTIETPDAAAPDTAAPAAADTAAPAPEAPASTAPASEPAPASEAAPAAEPAPAAGGTTTTP